MKKLILLCGAFAVLAMSAFAQSDDDFFGGSSDDSFFSDDDLFGDDSMFGDDTIVEVSDVSSKSDLSKGVIFNSGSIKVGGSVSASLSSNTLLYAPNDETTFSRFKRHAHCRCTSYRNTAHVHKVWICVSVC